MNNRAITHAKSVSPKYLDIRYQARNASFILALAIAGSKRVIPARQAGTFPAIFDLTSLDGTNGFNIVGITLGDGTGSSVSTAGDFNGDGIADLLIGAPTGMALSQAQPM